MSERTFDDTDMGYFLPEDSQLLLTQIKNHIHFLARLAQPRIAGESREQAPEVGMAELMFCLDQLAEQLELVLEDVSWLSRPSVPQEATLETSQATLSEGEGEEEEIDDELADRPDEVVKPAAMPYATPNGATPRMVFGITLEQIDALNLLVNRIMAYGDAVSADDMADFAPGTLAVLGHTIFDRANELNEVVTAINVQLLESDGSSGSVKEPAATYAVCPPPTPVRTPIANRPYMSRLH